MAALSRALSFFGPDIQTLEFPAWDCLPYDRVSPNASVVAQRMTALSRLGKREGPRQAVGAAHHGQRRVAARAGARVCGDACAVGRARQRHRHGRASSRGWNSTASRAPRPCASRATTLCAAAFSICFRPAWTCRCGSIFSATRWRRSRPSTRRRNAAKLRLRGLDLVPVAEFQLITETIRRFRTGYVAEFGAAGPDDLLYEAVSEGRRYPGMEHWLPLFHAGLETLLDYLPGTPLALEHLAEDAAHERFTQIADYYEARQEALKQGVTPSYKPLPPARLYLGEAEWKERLGRGGARQADAFRGARGQRRNRRRRARRPQFRGRTRCAQRQCVRGASPSACWLCKAAGKRVAIALWSEGARERMSHVLADHKLHNLNVVGSWPQALALPNAAVALAVLGIESGFETETAAIVSEQDILGDRLVRPRRAHAPRRQFHRRGDQSRARRSGRACRSRHRPLCRVAADHCRRRAARLSRNPLRGRRQALSAGRERRPVVALRRRAEPSRSRPPRRRQLAGAQGAHEEPHPRDRRRIDQGGGRAADARGAALECRAGRL